MKCERCGHTPAYFTGYCDPENGPSELDCDNTPDSLPYGKAWLCAPCQNDWETEQYWTEHPATPKGG